VQPDAIAGSFMPLDAQPGAGLQHCVLRRKRSARDKQGDPN
jgi:hypothetical protein